MKLSKAQWEHIGHTAGWLKKVSMRARLVQEYPGDQTVSVYSGKNKEPHFVIDGVSDVNELDLNKINEYLNGVIWTDKGAKGYITPRLRVGDFLKD
jgi:hypothetical protein